MAFADLIVGKWNRNLFPWFTPGSRLSGCISFVSYIKPQHDGRKRQVRRCCISFVSYIKPQPCKKTKRNPNVVYLSFPTSNHNFTQEPQDLVYVVYLSFPTSNHNRTKNIRNKHIVVYLSFPTSNHNSQTFNFSSSWLYIFRFLHQTTTSHLFW